MSHKKHLLMSLILLIILASSSLQVSPVLAQDAQPQETGFQKDFCTSTMRVMPLGDSITKGSSSGVVEENKMIAYRKDLWDGLVATGYTFDFVGSLTNGTFYTGFDAHHEGQAGKTADYIRDNVYAYLTAKPADVILLHIGTNDISTTPAPAQPIQEIVTEVSQILDNIDSYEQANSVHITVILAQIINRIGGSQATTDFNALLKQMAEARIAAGDDLIIVNMETGAGLIYKDYLAGGDMIFNGGNGLHPYHTGYTKMAAVWQQAIESLYQGCNQAPVVANPGHQSSADLEKDSLQIQASDPEGNQLTYSAENLPPGLTINPATGFINGIVHRDASKGSPYLAKVIVTDNGNPSRSGQVTFSWTVSSRQLVFMPLALFVKK